jgi:hypothetical protein
MKLSELQRELIEAARRQTPNDAVPYAFEKRVMARIRSMPAVSAWSLWGRLLWKAAASSVVITVLCGVWSFSSIKHSEAENFSTAFETAVYASFNQHVEDTW